MKRFSLAGLYMDPKAELAKQFLMRADDDLQISEIILEESEPIYWAAAFHAQQCAEKALKGLLTFHDIRAGKTHDIGVLLKLSLPVLPGLEKFTERASALTAYAVDFRYPVQYGDITKKEATEAIEIARAIYEFVLNSLPNLAEN
jgi:HEPN domain-containing protein